MSLNKEKLHRVFRKRVFRKRVFHNDHNRFFIILPDFVTFLQMYLSSEEFKNLICSCVKEYIESHELTAHILHAHILHALGFELMIVRIFDEGCTSCNEVVDFTEPTTPNNLNLSLDFHYSQNPGICPKGYKCFTILPDPVQLIPNVDLSKSLIHATVSDRLSSVLTQSNDRGDLFRTGHGSSQVGDSLEVQPPQSQSLESQDINTCVKNVNLVTERDILESSNQLLNDVNQLRQPVRSSHTSLSHILSLFTGLATSVIRGLKTTVGMGGGSIIKLRKYRKKTIHRILKNKKYSKKYSKKQNKIIRRSSNICRKRVSIR